MNVPEENSKNAVARHLEVTSRPVGRALIGLDETAVKLDVCKKTVLRLIDDKELGPKVKVRGSVKLFIENVDAYLKRIRMLAERKCQPV
jgi:hypothetical protein